MRIESFIRGRSIGTESAYDAFMTYISVICLVEGKDNPQDISSAMPKLVMDNLGMFLSSLIDNGQIHIANLQGERLLDQYIVHDIDYDSFQFV